MQHPPLVTMVFVIFIRPPVQWLFCLSPRIGYESYRDIFDFEYHPDERQELKTRQVSN